jgi:Pyruvate:ferredoxin oxidoreductase and related 2-oxoacid:ferredoxin oxidoreductases, alpha subunit
MDIDNPKNTCITAGPAWNTEFRYQQHVATLKAAAKIKKIDAEFAETFGRAYGGLLECYHCDDAEAVLVTLGSVSGTARVVVDQLRAKGQKVGLLKLRCLRPFPREELAKAVGKAKAVGVLEKDISFGYEGTVFSAVNSTLVALDDLPPTYNFVAGLGGRNISKDDIAAMFAKLLRAAGGTKQVPNIEFVKLGCEGCEC